MSTNLQNYTKAVYTLDAVLQRVAPEQWDNQSPCEEWSARQVLGHVIWHAKRTAATCNGIEGPATQTEAEVAGADPISSWNVARDGVLAALDQSGALQIPTNGPLGESTIDADLVLPTMDILTHAWDVATATEQNPAIPNDLAESAYALIAGAGDFVRQPGILGPALQAPADADIVTRYLALAGRQA